MDAERESVKYKQVEFIEKHIGEVFEGYVSGIIERGIFVELKDTRIEGRVSFDTMNEPFDIGDGRLKAKGMRTGKEYHLGGDVKVRILRADLGRRTIDMEFV